MSPLFFRRRAGLVCGLVATAGYLTLFTAGTLPDEPSMIFTFYTTLAAAIGAGWCLNNNERK